LRYTQQQVADKHGTWFQAHRRARRERVAYRVIIWCSKSSKRYRAPKGETAAIASQQGDQIAESLLVGKRSADAAVECRSTCSVSS
jgi:hypothetical protein